MTTILGAMLSMAVIVGAGVITWQIRGLMRYVDARKKVAELARRPADPLPSGVRRLRIVPCLRRRFRPRCAAIVAGAAAVVAVVTAALFAGAARSGSAPNADPPVTHTITTTVGTGRPTATITIDGRQPAAVTEGKTPVPGLPSTTAPVVAVPSGVAIRMRPTSPAVTDSPRSEPSPNAPVTATSQPSVAGGTTGSGTPSPSASILTVPTP